MLSMDIPKFTTNHSISDATAYVITGNNSDIVHTNLSHYMSTNLAISVVSKHCIFLRISFLKRTMQNYHSLAHAAC